MKDFAKKHPINKPKTRRVKTSLRAKRELNQPLKIKHLFVIAAVSALLLFASNQILQTDVVNIRGDVRNPTIEFLYPIELAKDTVLIELDGIVVEEDCEYLIQIESYGKRVYAQEQLGSLLSLGPKTEENQVALAHKLFSHRIQFELGTRSLLRQLCHRVQLAQYLLLTL